MDSAYTGSWAPSKSLVAEAFLDVVFNQFKWLTDDLEAAVEGELQSSGLYNQLAAAVQDPALKDTLTKELDTPGRFW